MTGRETPERGGTIARIKASLGVTILGLSLCGLASGLLGLTWQMPQQYVVAAISFVIGWRMFGR